MNVELIEMDKTKAKAILADYRGVLQKNRDANYHALRQGYKALAKGLRLIDVGEAIKRTGLDHVQRPRLAICRADAEHVYWRTETDGGGLFSMDNWPDSRATKRNVRMPADTFPRPGNNYRGERWKAIVPLIPPPLRPPHALTNYHILWEAEWNAVPRDPILLRRLGGLLFIVLAQWDLTPLEQAILRGSLAS